MDREGDFDALAIKGALIDLSRTLDSLRERLEPRERTQSYSELSPPHHGTPAEPDAQTLGIVHELLSPPSAGLQPSEILAHAMDRVARPLAIRRAMLFVTAAGEGRLVARAARGFRKEDLGSISVTPGEGIVGRAFAERRLVEYPGVAAAEAPGAFTERMRLGEAIALPVRSAPLLRASYSSAATTRGSSVPATRCGCSPSRIASGMASGARRSSTGMLAGPGFSSMSDGTPNGSHPKPRRAMSSKKRARSVAASRT